MDIVIGLLAAVVFIGLLLIPAIAWGRMAADRRSLDRIQKRPRRTGDDGSDDLKVRVVCPHCARTYRARPEHLGSQATCRDCGRPFPMLPPGATLTDAVAVRSIGRWPFLRMALWLTVVLLMGDLLAQYAFIASSYEGTVPALIIDRPQPDRFLIIGLWVIATLLFAALFDPVAERIGGLRVGLAHPVAVLPGTRSLRSVGLLSALCLGSLLSLVAYSLVAVAIVVALLWGASPPVGAARFPGWGFVPKLIVSGVIAGTLTCLWGALIYNRAERGLGGVEFRLVEGPPVPGPVPVRARVKRVDSRGLAVLTAATGLYMGFVYLALAAVAGWLPFGGPTGPQRGVAAIAAGAVVTVALAPVLCAAAGLVGALAYNLAARITGGLAVEVT